MRARAAEQLSAATAALVTQGNIEAEAVAAAEAERLAAEAAEKLALEEAATDPNVRIIRALVAEGKSSKGLAAALADLPVKGPAARMRVLYEVRWAMLWCAGLRWGTL